MTTPNGSSSLLRDDSRRRILDRHRRLTDEGKLFTPRELDWRSAFFRERFGPRALAIAHFLKVSRSDWSDRFHC